MAATQPGRWSVDAGGRYLRRDGQLSLLLGDTAWELIHRLREDETQVFLERRAEQGFNTVFVVAVAEFDGVTEPTTDGLVPFPTMDPGSPGEPYWQHVDRVVALAESADLTVGLLPTWGRWWHAPFADGPPLLNPGNAHAYGEFLGSRYRDADVLWVLGGDRVPTTPDHFETISLLAQGIRAGGADQLMTFHPAGARSSSDTHADADFIAFDMCQSGHSGWANPNYQYVEQDYRREPHRPTLDGEPNYEHHPVMTPQWKPMEQRFDERDVRRSAYHAVLAGAAGHVYGCHDVWQMFDPTRDGAMAEPINEANLPWRQAIDLPGAQQIGHLATLVTDVDLFQFVPDQSLIAYGAGVAASHQRAMRTDDGALVYAPGGRAVHVDLSRWTGPLEVRWFDPRAGRWHQADGVQAGRRVTVPHAFDGDDGVLRVSQL